MQVYRAIQEVAFQKETILTLGMYDGIHVGHQEIIRHMVAGADMSNARTMLVTFYPHPQAVIKNDASIIDILTPMDEKIEILGETGLDALFIMPFTLDLAAMEPETFVEDLIVKQIGIQRFVVGYNHALGRGRRGKEDLFTQLGEKHHFDLNVIPQVEVANHVVSSSKIRELIRRGDVHTANKLLGRQYRLRGNVKKGKQLGKTLGFPTANIEVSGDHKLIPGNGVYAVYVTIDGDKFPAMANIGSKPTIPDHQYGVEVHIHDINRDLYGVFIQIEFIERLRDEIKFTTMDDLAKQIAIDQKQSKEVLKKYIGGS